jgi:hypothetical protein
MKHILILLIVGSFSLDAKITCKKIKSCDDACYYLLEKKIKGLDRDHDGIPCESKCSVSCKNLKKYKKYYEKKN